MKVPECINLEIAALEQQKPLRWTSSNHFQLKAKKALRRYFLCKKRRRANYHYKQYLQFNARSFEVSLNH